MAKTPTCPVHQRAAVERVAARPLPDLPGRITPETYRCTVRRCHFERGGIDPGV